MGRCEDSGWHLCDILSEEAVYSIGVPSGWRGTEVGCVPGSESSRECSVYEDVFLGPAYTHRFITDSFIFLAFFVIVPAVGLAELTEECDVPVFGGCGQSK